MSFCGFQIALKTVLKITTQFENVHVRSRDGFINLFSRDSLL